MTSIIDRRLNPRDKTIKNRQKFIQRSKAQIKEAVKRAIDSTDVADIGTGKTRVKVKGTSEPTFSTNSKSGNKKYVLPGNKDHIVGDRQDKPDQNGGSGKGGSNSGEGEDDFEFLLTEKEFQDFLFEDLELPDLVKKQLKDTTAFKMEKSGFKSYGNPAQLDIVRSLKNSLGRRIGLNRPTDEQIEYIKALIENEDTDKETLQQLHMELEELLRKQAAIPWLDPFDVRYRNYTPVPKPMTKAVQFCVMDISASMGEKEKEIAKRFFLLLHLFLKRKYQKVEVVFISHHTTALEVTEYEFFYSKETGGTVVSTALVLTNEIIKQRYSPQDWNIYVAQCSDGDNYVGDTDQCVTEIVKILGSSQYFAYVETRPFYNVWGDSNATTDTEVWSMYAPLADEHKHLHMRQVTDTSQIWKVFHDLFKKERG